MASAFERVDTQVVGEAACLIDHADALTCLGHGDAAWQALLDGASGLVPASDIWADDLGRSAGHVGRLHGVKGEERVIAILEQAFDRIVPADFGGCDMVIGACSLGDLTGPYAGRPAEALDAVLARRAPALRPRAVLVSSACSSGTDALIMAHAVIRCGGAKRVGVLAFDTLSRGKLLQHVALGTQSPDRCRPFDAARSGTSFGEGAACIVLSAGGASSHAGGEGAIEVVGVGMSCDAADIVAPDMSGAHAAQAVRQAMTGASVLDLGYVNLHGSGTRLSDQAETVALRLALGASALDEVPLSSTKGAFGHCLGATGLIELVVTTWALRDRTCPPTAGLRRPDDLSPARLLRRCAPLPSGRHTALSVTYGFGGVNSAVLLRASQGRTS